MTNEPGEKPILHVDEDWKGRVEQEKRQAVEQRHAAEQGASASDPSEVQSSAAAPSQSSEDPSTDAAPEPARRPQRGKLPPATLDFLVTTIASQAMIALGELPNPFTGKAEVSLDQARHFIDTLSMLEAKTQGNRTSDESALLDSVLHQMRMAFVLRERGDIA